MAGKLNELALEDAIMLVAHDRMRARHGPTYDDEWVYSCLRGWARLNYIGKEAMAAIRREYAAALRAQPKLTVVR